MKNIVIAGAGFGGVRCALDLAGRLKRSEEYKVVVIDQNLYHLYTPSLYEVATAEIPKRCVCLPFAELFKVKNITFFHGRVETINSQEKFIELGSGDKIPYEFLVLSLGGVPDYFAIPGLEKYSFGLKSLKDAVNLKSRLQEIFKEIKEKSLTEVSRDLQIVVGGGGFSGVELAGELAIYFKHLEKDYELKPGKVTLSLVEASPNLLLGIREKISRLARKRLEKLGVEILVNTPIAEVRDGEITFADGQKVQNLGIIWTGGIRAAKVAENSGLAVDKKGRLIVDENLKWEGGKEIFALGDNACFIDPRTAKAVPGQAEIAIDQGRLTAKNIFAAITGKPLEKFHPKISGFVVPIGGNYGVASAFGFVFTGYVAIVLKKIIELRYLFSILPLPQALKFFRQEARLLLDT